LVRNFHDLGALYAICDKDPQVRATFQELYPEISSLKNLDNLLDDASLPVNAVAIATPAATHYDLVKRCLLAGKHVFVEKPLALTEHEGREIISIAERNKLILMVGHILQYHGAVIKLKELIDSGELGKIQYCYSNRLNIGKIRTEENILWSFAPHDISVILMLLSEMPNAVYATGEAYLQERIPDTTLTTLDFPSGVKAHIFVSWLHPFKEQKLIVVGDKKMAVFDDLSQEKLKFFPHTIQWLNRVPIAAKAEAEIIDIETEEPLKAECKHFLDCIANGQSPKTDGNEGLRVLQVLEASQRSLNENGRKVNVYQASPPIAKKQKSISPEASMGFEQGARSYFIHESSYVDERVAIGVGTRIWHFSHILSGSKIGEGCNIGQNVVIGPDVTIGNGCKIQNNVSIYKGVTLEDGVFCGPSMIFTNVYNPRAEIRKMDQVRSTLVKKGATIGANATIICGITLGRYCFIGAGAVVAKDVPNHALMVGNPAQQTGWFCECGEKLDDNFTCEKCRKKYREMEDGLKQV